MIDKKIEDFPESMCSVAWLQIHTEPDGKPRDDVGNVDRVIDKLLTKVVSNLSDTIPFPRMKELLQTAVFPVPPNTEV